MIGSRVLSCGQRPASTVFLFLSLTYILFLYIIPVTFFGILCAHPCTTASKHDCSGNSGAPTVLFPPVQVPSLSIGTTDFSTSVGFNSTLGDFSKVDWLVLPARISHLKPRGRPLRLSCEYPLPTEHLRPQYLRANFLSVAYPASIRQALLFAI